MVPPGTFFIDSTVVDGLPNLPFANTSQPLEVVTQVRNNGGSALFNVGVSLLRDTTVLDSRVITVPANDTVTVRFGRNAPATAGNVLYTTRIDSARSQVTGLPVQAGTPSDNSELIIVQTPALLSVGAVPPQVILILGQDTLVSATVSNSGEAGFGSGTLVLSLPGNYSTIDLLEQGFSEADPTVTWRVSGDAITGGAFFDSLLISFGTVPNDTNTATTAAVQATGDTAVVEAQVVAGGAVAITNIRLITPPGAVDDTISTSQSFTLEGAFSFVGSVDTVGRQAEIILPAGYALQSPNIVTLGSGVADTATWDVTAPSSVVGANDTFRIELSADEFPSGNPLADTLDHEVYLVDRVALALRDTVLAPLGATDLTVSTDQSFVMGYYVDNSGQAGTTDSSEVRLVLPTGFSFDPFPSVRTVDTVLVGTG